MCALELSKEKRSRRGQEGIVLVVVLLLVTALILLGTGAIVTSTTDLRIGGNYRDTSRALYAAEGGAEYGYGKLKQQLQSLTPNLSIAAPTLAGYTFDEFTTPLVAQNCQSVAVLTGNFTGLTAAVCYYSIASQARVSGSNASKRVSILVRDELIPIFQFGIFYDDDMEIIPGANMTFSGGRIHSNSDIYFSSDGATLSIDAMVTTAGDLYRGRKDNPSATPGTVQIRDASGNYQALNIDSNSSDWATASQDTWNGRVKTGENGITKLNLPTQTGNPRDLLGTGAGSMYSKAGLRIVNGVATNKSGTTVSLLYRDTSYRNADGTLKIDPGANSTNNVNPISTSSFTDQREGTTITAYNVDLAKLQNSTAAITALSDPPTGSDPNILYVSSTSNSVRLVNGSSLPTGGLTVASSNPIYIQGDYNTASAQPASVIGDAITVLSNSWSDASSSSSNLNDRTASNTTVNAAFMGGNKNSSSGQYSGGVENFIRFLENWTNKTFTYRGSLICLWQSQQATGNWRYGSPVYTAPIRNWSYGISANNLPPGTPRVRNVYKVSWQTTS
ncbi:MAG: PilX N-terminal domain-containing pilus assembly protein [Smithellaceae bacterium]|nr:PilX N-terminal domain-containing pilus assembly protein [Smithellaceae bacterium]